MKNLYLICLVLFLPFIAIGQCPDGNNTDTDGDGVPDCIDPCINNPTSIVGNMSFESDFIGWNIPQNASNFSVVNSPSSALHGNKHLLVQAPNAGAFEGYAIQTEPFVLKPNVSYNIKIPVKKTSAEDGDAIRWVLIDENGVYRHFNNNYSTSTEWTSLDINNLVINFDFFSSDVFSLRLEFGLSTVDMLVDKIEFYESALGSDPAYTDLNGDGLPDCDSIDYSDHPDYNALVAIYNATDGANWTNNANWLNPNVPVSNWHGVTEVGGRVQALALVENNLNGQIPKEIGDLTELINLHFGGNPSLRGRIPIEIGNLTNLETLALFNCNLFGQLPEEIGNLSNLYYLGLFNNSFSGELPSTVSNLTQLLFIEIFNNYFNGSIPNLQSGFGNLLIFNISNNNFEGPLPDFTVLPNLSTLWINGNNFQFGDFENEHNAYASNSNLNYNFSPQNNPTAPASLGLDIGESGTITSQISGSQNTYTWIRDNNDGTTSGIDFDDILNITITDPEVDYTNYWLVIQSPLVPGLTLRTNDFYIEEPASNHPDYNDLMALYNATDGPNWTRTWDLNAPITTWQGLSFNNTTNRIEWISIDNNNLTGTIPPEVGNMTTLTRLILLGNNLTGEVPNQIWNLTNLEYLWLGIQASSTAYTPGTLTLPNGIPAEISNMQNLYWLNLSGIALSQPLQPELFNLPNLTLLRLQDCGITGNLPPEFANISRLLIDRNGFEGDIPSQIINTTNESLGLSGNYFDFSDLEPLANNNNITNLLTFSPQRTRDEELEIVQAPGQDITLNVNDTDIERSVTNADANIYQWYKDDVPISGADNTSYTIFNAQPSDSGVYHCEITNSILPDLTIVRADITINIDQSLSVDEPTAVQIFIYPNPVKGKLFIENSSETIDQIKVFNMLGKVVQVKKNINQNQTNIDLSELASGVYLVQVSTDQNQKLVKRVIKK